MRKRILESDEEDSQEEEQTSLALRLKKRKEEDENVITHRMYALGRGGQWHAKFAVDKTVYKIKI